MSKQPRVHSNAHPPTAVRIAIVGGDGRPCDAPAGTAVRSYPSARHGGNGRIAGIRTALRNGSFDLVILLVRWLGHSQSRKLAQICRSERVLVQLCPSGATGAARLIRRFMKERNRGR